MYEPSVRRIGFAMRTTTARTTSPFLTALFGMACLIEHTTTSPTVAYRRGRAPRQPDTIHRPAPPLFPASTPVVPPGAPPLPRPLSHPPASLFLAVPAPPCG